MKFLSAAALAILLLLAALATPNHGTAVAQQAAPSGAEMGARLMNFYRTANIASVPALIGELERNPMIATPEGMVKLAGFFGGLFAKHPAHIDAMLVGESGPRMKRVLALGLSLANKPEHHKRHGTKWGLDTSKGVKGWTFADAKVRTGGDLDMHWSASFASGDVRYVRPIWNHYAQYANRSDTDLADIDAMARIQETRDNSSVRAIAERLGREKFVELAVASSALWSLRSNARQHEFVRRGIDAFMAQQKNSKAARGFSAART